MELESLKISSDLKGILKDRGYHTLTQIQSCAIPPLLMGKDVIGQSRTGSGKTAAFAIPILEKVDTRKNFIQALILCPTRELSQQVAREVRSLGRYKRDLRVVVLSGGHPLYLDKRALEHGAQIIVGTPGRLIDHLERKTIDVSRASTVVLDEADRMLDLGFKDKIEQILQTTPKDRQTLFFSATFPPTIEALSRHYQRTPERITIETPATDLPTIEQYCYTAPPENKKEILYRFLAGHNLESTLIFCNQRLTVDEVTAFLKQKKISADRLHGNLDQNMRERVMAKFRNHTTRVLVATDVAARGLDIAGLDAVINYDLPNEPAIYVHRIGRTGRAGATGLAVSFVTPVEGPRLKRIEEFIQVPLPFRELSLGSPKSPALALVETLSISGGRKEKLRAGDILGALTGDIGLKSQQVGKIEILDHISFVALDREIFREALSRLQKGKIKGRRFLIQRVN